MIHVALGKALASHCEAQCYKTTGALNGLWMEWDEEGIWNQEQTWAQVLALLLSDCALVSQAYHFSGLHCLLSIKWVGGESLLYGIFMRIKLGNTHETALFSINFHLNGSYY